MLRGWGAGVSALALLVGFVAAPHTHLHLAGQGVVSDAQHALAQTTSVVHAHLTPHHSGQGHDAHRDADHGDVPQTASVDVFVFQAAASPTWPSPVTVQRAVTLAPVPTAWAGVSAHHPRAHGPPSIRPPASRAPPLFLPSAF